MTFKFVQNGWLGFIFSMVLVGEALFQRNLFAQGPDKPMPKELEAYCLNYSRYRHLHFRYELYGSIMISEKEVERLDGLESLESLSQQGRLAVTTEGWVDLQSASCRFARHLYFPDGSEKESVEGYENGLVYVMNPATKTGGVSRIQSLYAGFPMSIGWLVSNFSGTHNVSLSKILLDGLYAGEIERADENVFVVHNLIAAKKLPVYFDLSLRLSREHDFLPRSLRTQLVSHGHCETIMIVQNRRFMRFDGLWLPTTVLALTPGSNWGSELYVIDPTSVKLSDKPLVSYALEFPPDYYVYNDVTKTFSGTPPSTAARKESKESKAEEPEEVVAVTSDPARSSYSLAIGVACVGLILTASVWWIGKKSGWFIILIAFVFLGTAGCVGRPSDRVVDAAGKDGIVLTWEKDAIRATQERPAVVRFLASELSGSKQISIPIYNRTGKTLELDSEVGVSCGCSTASLQATRIKPGGSVQLGIQIDRSTGKPVKDVTASCRVVSPKPCDFLAVVEVLTQLEWSVLDDRIFVRGMTGETAKGIIRVWVPQASVASEIQLTGIPGMQRDGEPIPTLSSSEFDLPFTVPIPSSTAQINLGLVTISHPRLQPPSVVRPVYATIEAVGSFGTPIVGLRGEEEEVQFDWLEGWHLDGMECRGPITLEWNCQDEIRRAEVLIRKSANSETKDQPAVVIANLSNQQGKTAQCHLRVVTSIDES